MQRFNKQAFVLAALMASFLITETAEAQRRTRSIAERRQRPGKGFWAQPSQSRSYNNSGSNWSLFRSSPGYSAPQTYVQPSNTVYRSQPRVIHRSHSTPGMIVQPQSIASNADTVIHSQPSSVIPNSTTTIHSVRPPQIVDSPVVCNPGVVQPSQVISPPMNSQPANSQPVQKPASTTEAPSSEKR